MLAPMLFRGLSPRCAYQNARDRDRRSANSAGFTMVELLVAMVITLIMMGAVATLFGLITENVAGSRATIEMTERLRSASYRLQLDLAGATCTMLPPRRPESGEGYFEILEGIANDSNSANVPNENRFGDFDDVLMFTSRSRGEPFIGRFTFKRAPVGSEPATSDSGGQFVWDQRMIESQVAEVNWIIAETPNATAVNPAFAVYRSAWLVVKQMPDFDTRTPAIDLPTGYTASTWANSFDISARFEGGQMVPNTLSDLTKREHRFAHGPNFPNLVGLIGGFPVNSPRYGDDIALSEVLAFDVQVYDPNCPLKVDASTGTVLTPRDRGYAAAALSSPLMHGAFVDLSYWRDYVPAAGQPTPWFNGNPSALSKLDGAYAPSTRFTYDTWSLHYENNYVDTNNNGTVDAEPADKGNEDDDNLADEGTNGFDDPGLPGNVADGVIDDPGEMETQPPYPHPLRGVRVTIRVYETDSRQVREVNVEQDFLPE